MNDDRMRRGPRGNISVLATADRMLRADGLHRLSLCAVARGTGIASNAVCTYVATTADSRNALGDGFLIGRDLGLLRTGASQEALRCFVEHVPQAFAQSSCHVQMLASPP